MPGRFKIVHDRGIGDAGLFEDQLAFLEGHQRGQQLDPGDRGQIFLGFDVDFAMHDVKVFPRRRLVGRCEQVARGAQRCPKVHKHVAVGGDGLLEIRRREVSSGHGHP